MNMPVLALFFAVIMLQTSKAEEKINVSSARIVKIINSNWTFNYYPSEKPGSGYELASFDDSKWQGVSLPHTWNTFGTTGEVDPKTDDFAGDNYWYSGWGCYRKRFRAEPEYSGKKIFLEFDGVQSYCRVWFNGKLLGEHTGGYGRFDFDITSLVKFNAENIIAVSVSNKNQEPAYNLYGGIHRNVTIVIRNPLYIPMQGSASHEGGTSISTFDVSRSQGYVSIQTWVKNDYTSPRVCILQTNIRDKAGKTVQSLKSTAEIKPGETYRFSQVSKSIKNPHLWSPVSPYMYSVASEVFEGRSLVDSYESSFGFRWFEQKDDGLYVNDEKVSLIKWVAQGDYPFIGTIIPEGLFKQALIEAEESVGDHLFMQADYPMQEYIFDLADENGLITEEGIPAGVGENQSPELKRQQISEAVRRDRNHPSILFWRPLNGSANEFYNIIRGEDPGRIIVNDDIRAYVSESPALSLPVKTVLTNAIPAKIVLETTDENLIADRGSVAKIDVIITGTDGQIAGSAYPALKWSVSGPAKLAGPPVLNSDDKSLPSYSRYNFIRSTGEPGLIVVKVYAPGLQSGELRIPALRETIDETGIIEFPVPGRGKVEDAVNRTDQDIFPGEIRSVTQDLNFINNSNYRDEVKNYIHAGNNSIDTSSVEFRALADILDSYLRINGGKITADDYNYNTGQFNLCTRIARYITATKLPAAFKAGLRDYYSTSIIRAGNQKDAEQEMNWLNWIPSGGTVIYYLRAKDTVPAEGQISRSSDLAGLIAEVYPVFNNFSDDAKTRAIEFIRRMNPFVHLINDTSKGESSSPSAEEGKPVLIPLLKFISE